MANNTLTQLNQLQISFKKLLGKAHTNPNFEWFNETLPSSIQLSSDYIFGQSIPSLTTTPANYTITQNSSGQNVVETVTFTLEEIAASQYDASHTSVINGTTIDQQAEDSENTSQIHAYKLVLPSDYTTLSSNPNEGSDPFTNSKVVADTTGALQIIPESFGVGYRPIVNDSTGTSLSILGEENWVLDPYIGVLWVQDRGGSLKTPASVTASIYIGDFVTDALGNAGDTVDLHFSASEGGGFSFANAATASFESGSAGITVTATPASNKITIGANTDNVNFNHISASGDIVLGTISQLTSTNLDSTGQEYGNVDLATVDVYDEFWNIPVGTFKAYGLRVGSGSYTDASDEHFSLLQLGTNYIIGGSGATDNARAGLNFILSGSGNQGTTHKLRFFADDAGNEILRFGYNDFLIKGTDDVDSDLSEKGLEFNSSNFKIYSGSGTTTVFDVSRQTKAATFAGEVTATGGFVGSLEGTASVASQVVLTDDDNGVAFRPIVFANPATGASTLYTDETTLSYQPSKGQLNVGYNANFLALQSSSIQSLIQGNTFNFLTATTSEFSDLTTINIGNADITVNIYNSASIDGDLTVGGQIYGTSSYALSASKVYVTDNESTNANYPIVFHGGTADGYVDLQSDESTFTWNPGVAGGTLTLGNEGSLIIINTGSINTTSTTFDLLMAGPTTINAFGTANTLNIGSTTAGTATIKNTSIILGTQNTDKTIVSGTLEVKGGAIGTDDATFNLLNNTATTINFGGAATNITMGAANGTVNIAGSASIAGDLIVRGNVTSINTTELNIEDQFILLNSGSVEQDGGIIVQTDGNANGTALFYDNSSNRWALAQSSSVAWNAVSATAHQYVVSVSSSNTTPTGNPANFGLDDASWYGMMYVDTTDTTNGGLYIYLP